MLFAINVWCNSAILRGYPFWLLRGSVNPPFFLDQKDRARVHIFFTKTIQQVGFQPILILTLLGCTQGFPTRRCGGAAEWHSVDVLLRRPRMGAWWQQKRVPKCSKVTGTCSSHTSNYIQYMIIIISSIIIVIIIIILYTYIYGYDTLVYAYMILPFIPTDLRRY